MGPVTDEQQSTLDIWFLDPHQLFCTIGYDSWNIKEKNRVDIEVLPYISQKIDQIYRVELTQSFFQKLKGGINGTRYLGAAEYRTERRMGELTAGCSTFCNKNRQLDKQTNMYGDPNNY